MVNSVWGQSLILTEDFTNYTNGNLGTQGSWVQNGSGTDVQVASSAPLSYSGYGSAGGSYVTVSQTNGFDPHKLFSSTVATSSSSTFYVSFLINVSSATTTAITTSAAYSLSLRNTLNTAYFSRFFIAKDASNNLKLGISVLGGDGSGTYSSGNYSFTTTYLIVIRYDIGATTDNMYMWVNPATNVEPSVGSADVVITGQTKPSYGTPINSLMIHQRSATVSPVASFDGFKVSNSSTSAAAWTNLALPVSFSSISATNIGKNNKVTWSTASEEHNRGFDVQRSTDGVNYTSLGFVNSLSSTGNSSSALNYSFIDYDPIGLKQYYRLKQTDFDGTSRYSGVVVVTNAVPERLAVTSIYPNPASSFVHLSVASPSREAMQLIVTDANGRTVRNKYVNAEVGNNSFEVDVTGLGAGIYYLSLKGPLTGWQSVGKFVKN